MPSRFLTLTLLLLQHLLLCHPALLPLLPVLYSLPLYHLLLLPVLLFLLPLSLLLCIYVPDWRTLFFTVATLCQVPSYIISQNRERNRFKRTIQPDIFWWSKGQKSAWPRARLNSFQQCSSPKVVTLQLSFMLLLCCCQVRHLHGKEDRRAGVRVT